MLLSGEFPEGSCERTSGGFLWWIPMAIWKIPGGILWGIADEISDGGNPETISGGINVGFSEVSNIA